MSQPDRFYAEYPLVFAHRGASDVAPENTLAAFEAALAADADGIELDVTRCATGEIVVIHDDTLDRTTNGSGRVDETPWAALRALDAGSWFAPAFSAQRVPLLTEVLDLVGHRLRINIELKGITLHPTGMEEDVAAMVRARGLQDEVILSSFNPSALWRARKVAPELRRGLLYATQLPIYLARAWSRLLLQPNALHPEFHIINAAYLHWAQQRGYHVNVWTVNEPQDLQDMLRLGVDAIITNYPARLRALLPR